MCLLYSRFLVAFSRQMLYFFYFHSKTVESAFKMAAIQVLFNAISLCVTTLTELKRWIVIELYYTVNSNNLSGLSKCM